MGSSRWGIWWLRRLFEFARGRGRCVVLEGLRGWFLGDRERLVGLGWGLKGIELLGGTQREDPRRCVGGDCYCSFLGRWSSSSPTSLCPWSWSPSGGFGAARLFLSVCVRLQHQLPLLSLEFHPSLLAHLPFPMQAQWAAWKSEEGFSSPNALIFRQIWGI